MTRVGPAVPESASDGLPRWVAALVVCAAYVGLSLWYTSPLVPLASSRIAGDPGDPVLNASILWWNATTTPLTSAWWNAPIFYPSLGVTTFTEHLLGVSVVASPVYWLTHNPLTTYNVSLLLTWPLSAFAVYLLVAFISKRYDAAFLAGLAWAFTPYRLSELGHLQSLSAYWFPIMLLGLHGFLERRRPAWLVLFGAAWLLQSTANGYYMLFGAVLVGLWLAYFCSTRENWRALPAVLVTWLLASLPLVPILSKYLAVHDAFALRRSLVDPEGFSAATSSFAHVSDRSWIWSSMLADDAHSLFPGITAILLVLVGLASWIWRGNLAVRDVSRWRARLRSVAGVTALVSGAGVIAMVAVGPLRWTLAGVPIRATNFPRMLMWCVSSGAVFAWLTPSIRKALARRSPLPFYAAATVAFAILACGPLLIVDGQIILNPAPYAWLLSVPGFDRLRVPTRFWMLGTLCLAVSAGLSVSLLARRGVAIRALAVALAAAALMADGWMREFPMAAAPELWPRVERRDQHLPVVELPLGPEWDAAATYRAMWHRRHAANGVSGYDPPHYAPLQAGLNARDPQMLAALASLGPIDVVVDGSADRDGTWTRYVAGAAGVTVVASDGVRTTYRLPQHPPLEPALGPIIPIVSVDAFRHDARVAADGRIETEWGDDPQRPAQWITADLGQVREVAGLTHALGEYARDFPRLLAIDLSTDGMTWAEVWRGPTAALAFLAAARAPRDAAMRIAFPPRQARYVRLRQLAEHKNMWRVAELRVHGVVVSR